MTHPPKGTVVLVVDTESYAGNFERELVAHLTGQVGDCGVGREARDPRMPSALRAWCAAHVLHLADDHGIKRPATIWPTPGWFNGGMGTDHREGTPAEVVAKAYAEGVQRHAEGIRTTRWTDDVDVDEQVRRFVEPAMERGPGRYPAHLSVACPLDVEPPPWVVEALRERAEDFCARRNLRCTGVRVEVAP